MAVMEAYFDESGTHDGSPFVCVAGYLFQKGNATALDAAWRWMLEEKWVTFLPHVRLRARNGTIQGLVENR